MSASSSAITTVRARGASGAGVAVTLRRLSRRSGNVCTPWPGWRNRQTRRPQKALSERTCGFKSHTRHIVGGRSEHGVVPHIRPVEVVESALRASDAGMRDAENAALHGVTIKTIRRWRRDYQRRAKPRGGRSSSVPCPVCDGASLDERAYVELFGWYLGDGHISRHPRGFFGLHIFNDSRYVDLNGHILELMKRVKSGGSPYHRVTACTISTSWWKHWPCLFPQHGPGYKHTRNLEMADWQQVIVAAHPADFLRGLFHSDGCRVNNWATRTVAGERKRYDYPRWQFTNESADIMRWCGEALDLLDIPWRQTNRRTLSVSRRAAVARLDTLIGLKS